MRVLRRNPARRLADRHVLLVLLWAALCGLAAVAATVALSPSGADGDLAVVTGALAFVAGVTIAQWRDH